MNYETRTLISWWKIKAKEQRDSFIKFFLLYMCLDAWISDESKAEYDRDKLEWLINSENSLKKYWPVTPNIQSSLTGMKKRGMIENMHPLHRGEYRYLKDVNNFGEVVNFIYQIRCNLFHGGKSPVKNDDLQIVHWAAKILENWIGWTLLKTRREDSIDTVSSR